MLALLHKISSTKNPCHKVDRGLYTTLCMYWFYRYMYKFAVSCTHINCRSSLSLVLFCLCCCIVWLWLGLSMPWSMDSPLDQLSVMLLWLSLELASNWSLFSSWTRSMDILPTSLPIGVQLLCLWWTLSLSLSLSLCFFYLIHVFSTCRAPPHSDWVWRPVHIQNVHIPILQLLHFSVLHCFHQGKVSKIKSFVAMHLLLYR